MSLRLATAAAAAVGVLLIAANGGRLVSASGMLSTGKSRVSETKPGLLQSTRLDQLESGIHALRSMVEHQMTSAEQPPAPSVVAEKLAAARRSASAANAVAQTPPPPSLPPPPPPQSSPPPPPPSASSFSNDKVLTPDDVLQRVPKGELIFLALANEAYMTLGLNWAMVLLPVLERAGHPERAILAAMDQASERTFLQKRFATMRVGLGGVNASSTRNDDFRWQFGAFRAYGVTKAELIIWMLRAGRDVCMSDVDAAWIATPYAMLSRLMEADVLAGTDCLHIPEDDDRSRRNAVVARCGHHAGSRWHAWFNTGVMFFRAGRPAALDIALQWRDRMADTKLKNADSVDDQLTFNQMIGGVGDPRGAPAGGRKDHIYPVQAGRADGRVILAHASSELQWKIAALSAREVCTAHRYHIQQSSTPGDCVILHLTFVEGWPKNPAKYWRLREAGLFPVEPERFDGKFLSFTPPQPGIEPPERHPSQPVSHARGGMPDMVKDAYGRGVGWSVSHAFKWAPRLAAHVDLIDRHIAALRNAMAIAVALKRTLVMPKLMCMCERAESPFAILPQCTLVSALPAPAIPTHQRAAAHCWLLPRPSSIVPFVECPNPLPTRLGSVWICARPGWREHRSAACMSSRVRLRPRARPGEDRAAAPVDIPQCIHPQASGRREANRPAE